LKDPNKIADMLNLIANRLVGGRMEPKVAYALAYIANLSLKVNEVRGLAEQIAQAKLQHERLPDFAGRVKSRV